VTLVYSSTEAHLVPVDLLKGLHSLQQLTHGKEGLVTRRCVAMQVAVFCLQAKRLGKERPAVEVMVGSGAVVTFGFYPYLQGKGWVRLSEAATQLLNPANRW
jgi:hypothetical protein